MPDGEAVAEGVGVLEGVVLGEAPGAREGVAVAVCEGVSEKVADTVEVRKEARRSGARGVEVRTGGAQRNDGQFITKMTPK